MIADKRAVVVKLHLTGVSHQVLNCRLLQDLYAEMSSGIFQRTVTSNTPEYHIGDFLTDGGKRIPVVETVPM